MERLYFHFREGERVILDGEGMDLPDVSAARKKAVLTVREVLAEAIRSGRPKVPDALMVADAAGRSLDIVLLAAVLPEPLNNRDR
jgi:hypothetical protein